MSISLKSIFQKIVSNVVNEEKTVVTDIKDILTKAKPVITNIATDTTDILEGKVPPPTGNATLDAFLGKLAILAPAFVNAGLRSEIIIEIQALLTYVTDVAGFFGV